MVERFDPKERWIELQDSCMFRRGLNMASPGEAFLDVVSTLQNISQDKEQISVLTVGTAYGEEPLSLLVVFDSIAKQRGKNLDTFVDLNTVDVRPQPKNTQLVTHTYKTPVDYLLESNPLITDGLEPDRETYKYRVRRPIVAYLERTIADPTKSTWETLIQEYLHQTQVKTYDCISYNNVDMHIISAEDREFVIQGLLDRVRPGGVLITDNTYGGGNTLRTSYNYEAMKVQYGLNEIYPGIFKRER